MKKYIFLFAIVFFNLVILANPPLASKQQLGMFKNSITCVVLENDGLAYNLYITDAVKKNWKSTKYEFIDQQEFEKRRYDSRYSFLVLIKVAFDKDPLGISYSFLSLVLGDVSNEIAKMPEICSMPIAYSNDNTMEYGYVMPSIIKFMQKHAKNLEHKYFLISLQGLKYYNGIAGFKDKVMLLNLNMMAPNADTPENIKISYPFYVKLLTTAEIEAELATNPINTTFNFYVGPLKDSGAGKCFEMIFDVEGNLYYYHHRKITNENGNGFNLADFANIK